MDESIVDNDALINSEQALLKPEQQSALTTNKVNPEQPTQVEMLEEEAPRSMAFTKFFTFIEGYDWVLLILGTSSAIIAGALLPSISLVMGHVSSEFVDAQYGIIQPYQLMDSMEIIAGWIMAIAAGLFIFSYIFFSFWQHLAENIILDLRKRYIAALMTQEIAYFEINKVEQIPSQIAEMFDTCKSSIGEKIANLIFACATCFFGMLYALIYGPLYAFICICYLPVLIGILAVFGRMVQKSTLDKLNVIKRLGGVAEETLTAMKVVTSFTREERELEKFTENAKATEQVAKKASATMAVTQGLMKFAIFFFYAYTLFIGSIFCYQKRMDYTGNVYDQQIVIQTIIALITGFVGLIGALPNVQAIVASKTLGVLIFDVIERTPEIRNCNAPKDHVKLDEAIQFKNVTFKYPTSLPEHRPVLIDASFEIKAGQSTAIVGPSGSGKSTIVQLVERFYDPRAGGSVCFDDFDIKQLNLKVLRESIGYVSQEPVMIMGTIRDNLKFGNSDATEQDMNVALKQANATFVYDQENGLDTFVGTAGIMNMSGGQKQRIAIARALIKRPKILILDEATSALDPKSEIEVQEAIEAISKSGLNLTILIIAHRLTTIASADNLLYFASRSNLVSAAKGTPDYDEIFEKLKSIQYAKGDTGDDDEDDEQGLNQEERDHINRVKEEEVNVFMKYQNLINQDYFSGQDRNMTFVPRDSTPVLDIQGDAQDHDSDRGSLRSASEPLIRPYNPAPPEGQEVPQAPQTPRGVLATQRRTFNEEDQEDEIERLLAVHRTAERTKSMLTKARTESIVSDNMSEIEREIQEKINQEEDDNNFREVTYSEVMAYQNPRIYANIGFIASVFASLSLPLFGFVLSKFIFVLGLTNVSPSIHQSQADIDEEFIHRRNIWTIVFALLCLMIGFSTFIQKLSFGIGGENLTLALRIKLFDAFLHKNIGWFDNKNRAPGILTNMIAQDIQTINGLTTETAGVIAEAGLGLFFSVLISAIFSWQMAIVVALVSPLMVLGGLGMSKLQFNQKEVDESFKQANSLLSDIIINYRTAISFGEKNVNFILQRYNDLLIVPHESGIKRAHVSGLFFAYSQGIRFIFIAFIFLVAAVFVTKLGLDAERVFVACYVVFVGAIGSGVSISQMPSISKAKQSAKVVFGIIEAPSLIDPKQMGAQIEPSGRLEFRNLFFRYPSRTQYVLRNFNLVIEPNQSVAIVGHSGSGKSTIASLMLRFYDCQKGQVLIDDENIKDLDLEHYRQNISIVQQEPLLFNETIRQNILFGDLTSSDARVKECAVQANALGFIMQSDEDFYSVQVQKKVRDKYALVCHQQLEKQKHPQLYNLIKYAEEGRIDYKAVMLTSMLIPYMSTPGLMSLENDIENLIEALKMQAIKQDPTWQMVLQSFCFQPEIKKIKEYLTVAEYTQEQQDAGIKDYFVKEIQEAIFKNEGEFDLETVKSYQEYLPTVQEETKRQRFAAYLKQDRERAEQPFKEQYQASIHEARVRQAERELDPGFQKICGLKGGKLSGGQKQRVAIARALIKNPKFMILDEATSALDEQSQEIVQQALDRAMEGRTSVVIAHRMSTIKKCSRIVVLHKGRVVEDGTYDELSGKPGGHFAKLEKGIE